MKIHNKLIEKCNDFVCFQTCLVHFELFNKPLMLFVF